MSKKRWLVAGGSIAAAVAGLAGPAFAGWDGST